MTNFGVADIARLDRAYSTPQIVDQRQRFRAVVAARPSEVGLDVGCGAGHLACELARELAPAGRIVAIDRGPESVDASKARAAKENLADNYPRKFDINVLHRAALLGPGLLEVGLYDILPESCNMLTIQDSTDMGYTGTGTAFDRTVPALNLEDDKWGEVARYLIANARAIVCECLMLSEGVRTELEIIDRLGRNGDTLVVLPPPGGYLQRIDDDPLVRRFPNAVSASVLSDVPLAEVPFVAWLLGHS